MVNREPRVPVFHFACPDRYDFEEVVPTLTSRERDLVRLLAEGLTNRQMAVALCISEWTVKTHVQNLRQKYGVHTRAAVVARSWEEIQRT